MILSFYMFFMYFQPLFASANLINLEVIYRGGRIITVASGSTFAGEHFPGMPKFYTKITKKIIKKAALLRLHAKMFNRDFPRPCNTYH